MFNDPSTIKNTGHVNFKNHNIDKVRIVKVTSYPALAEHLTAKGYADEAICNSLDESSFLRLDLHEEIKLDEEDSIFFNSSLTSPKTQTELPTKTYVDSLHQNSRIRRDISTSFKDQDIEFDDIKLRNLDGITVIRNPNSDNELASKKYIHLMYYSKI